MKYILGFMLLVYAQIFFVGCSKHVVIVTQEENNNSTGTSGSDNNSTGTSGSDNNSTGTSGSDNNSTGTSGSDNNSTGTSGSDNNSTGTSGDDDKDDRDVVSTTVTETVYEDGNNLANWAPSETNSGHIGIVSASDGLIKITTTGKSARHILYKDSSKGNWDNSSEFIAVWDLKTDARYEVMFLVKTKNNGDVYIVYSNTAPVASGYYFDTNSGIWKKDQTNAPTNWGKYSYNTIEGSADGVLRTQVKDLLTDLRRVSSFANDEIVSVKYALVINWDKDKDVYIDNIKLKSSL